MTTTATAAPPRAARRACWAAFGIQGFTFASLITRLPTIKDQHDLSDYQVLMLPLLLTPVLVLMASRFAPLPIARERCKV